MMTDAHTAVLQIPGKRPQILEQSLRCREPTVSPRRDAASSNSLPSWSVNDGNWHGREPWTEPRRNRHSLLLDGHQHVSKSNHYDMCLLATAISRRWVQKVANPLSGGRCAARRSPAATGRLVWRGGMGAMCASTARRATHRQQRRSCWR
eukprot:COSAG01_NODE_4227_length_5224_cov_4.060683_5_plen_150_part_00